MKTEGLSAEEATEIIQRGGVVVDKDNETWSFCLHTTDRYYPDISDLENYAPYRVVTPPPDADPVVTAEEFLRHMCRDFDPEDYGIVKVNMRDAWTILDELKAARKPKPEPQPIRTLDEALACENARLREALKTYATTVDVEECGYKLLAELVHDGQIEARKALAQPPADASGLLRLVRDVLSVEWESIKLAVAYSPNISIERNSVLQEQMNNVLDALNNALDPALKAAADRGGRG